MLWSAIASIEIRITLVPSCIPIAKWQWLLNALTASWISLNQEVLANIYIYIFRPKIVIYPYLSIICYI